MSFYYLFQFSLPTSDKSQLFDNLIRALSGLLDEPAVQKSQILSKVTLS